ncbi:MAG: thiamine pyrophosphate-dependent dehydrogenase E1 component subunit alpha [Candidatus Omnitrophica bacterium]|nr:thiamine pyrophosphate-dependent dehydrogenase E1 component subunit alpha [Candidatus Omnitrophota bacterium]
MNNIDKNTLLELYRSLLLIRQVELKIEALYPEDEMKTPVHLSLGQEAVSAGICSQLKKEDTIYSNHRSHGHYLAKGGDLKAMIAELYCKETGCSRGRGGSMHLIDTSVGHFGSSSIVGGGIPHAVGGAFAYKMQKKDLIAVAFFGDAACEQGVFFESMNWAAFKKLPVLFVCENNQYAVCSHISARQYSSDIYKRSRAFDIPSRKINGNDVVEVYNKTKEILQYVRGGNGPYFLECSVQRWRGHAGPGDPLKDKYRHPADLSREEVDSLFNFQHKLLAEKIVTQAELDDIKQKIDADIKAAFEFGQKEPLPDTAELEKYLFAE